VYRFGQAIWYYIGTKYGDEKIGEIMQKAPLIGVREAFRQALNRDLEELSEDWLEAVRLTYMPQVVKYPSAEQAAVRLTNHIKDDASINVGPALSPDGSKVAFVSDRDYFNDLYIASAVDGENVDKLVKGERTETFESLRFLRVGMAWSPDGNFLTFSSKVGEQDALYIMRVRDERIVESLRFGLEGIETPSWSPDGQQIVFTGLDGGVSDLFIVRKDGSDLRRLTNDRYAQRDPVWSPDGTRLAFTTEFGPGTDFDLLAYDDYQIGIYDLSTEEITFLPDQVGKSINPQWGPDGKTIAFLSDRTGVTNIFLYDFDRAETYQLTDLLTGVSGIIDSSPALAWSRDGSRMVFSAFSDGGWDLYRIDTPLTLAVIPYEEREREEYDLVARAFVQAVDPIRPEYEEEEVVEPEDVVLGAEQEAVGPEGEDAAEGPEGEGAEEEEVAQVPPQPDAVSYYLGEEGRGGRRGAEGRPAVRRLPSFSEPVDVATLLSDPTIGLPRDTTTFERRDYKVRFQPDLVTRPEVGFVSGQGAFGASQLAFSDLLGDHNLLVSASVYGSISDSDLFFTYANLKRRWNYAVTGFQFRSDFAPLTSTASNNNLFLFRSDVYRGLQLTASYPLSRFRRLAFSGVFTHINRRVARFSFFDPTPDIEEDLPDDTYFAPSIAYIFDTAFYGSTGPVGGGRQRLEVQRSIGDRDFTQVYVDLRNYVLFKRRFTFATRMLFLSNFGQDEEDLRFQSIGGPTLLRGYDFQDDRLVGTNVGLMNLEFRFPLVDRPVIAGGGFPPLRGALWFDIGYARTDISCRDESSSSLFCEDIPFKFATSQDAGPLGFRLVDGRASFGAGVRMNLFGFAVVRFDYAKPTDMKTLDDGRFLFTLAPEF
jgi:Tol biopolymer transport system component